MPITQEQITKIQSLNPQQKEQLKAELQAELSRRGETAQGKPQSMGGRVMAGLGRGLQAGLKGLPYVINNQLPPQDTTAQDVQKAILIEQAKRSLPPTAEETAKINLTNEETRIKKSKADRAGKPLEIPEGFEITGFSVDGEPMIKRIKDTTAKDKRAELLDSTKIREEFINRPEIKEYTTISTQVKSMDALLKSALAGNMQNKVALDQALITMFNKLTDPQSVVRESEYARTPSNLPFVNAFNGALQKLQAGGAGMTDKDRKALVLGAKVIADERGKTYNDTLQQYVDLSNEYGIKPDLITRGLPKHSLYGEGASPQGNDQDVRTRYNALREQGLSKEEAKAQLGLEMPKDYYTEEIGDIERYGKGNIDLINRPRVKNPDNSISTVRSLGVNIDGQEVLIPTVSEDGRIMSNDEAVQEYRKTGKHLGKFNSVEESDNYAQQLHNSQANILNKNGKDYFTEEIGQTGDILQDRQVPIATTAVTPFLKNQTATEEKIASRVDPLAEISQDFKSHPIKTSLKYALVPGMLRGSATNLALQRGESAIANLGLGLQRAEPLQGLKQAGQGLLGQRQAELGDIIRTTGAGGGLNEPLSATIGSFGMTGIVNLASSGNILKSLPAASKELKEVVKNLPQNLNIRDYPANKINAIRPKMKSYWRSEVNAYGDAIDSMTLNKEPVNLEPLMEKMTNLMVERKLYDPVNGKWVKPLNKIDSQLVKSYEKLSRLWTQEGKSSIGNVVTEYRNIKNSAPIDSPLGRDARIVANNLIDGIKDQINIDTFKKANLRYKNFRDTFDLIDKKIDTWGSNLETGKGEKFLTSGSIGETAENRKTAQAIEGITGQSLKGAKFISALKRVPGVSLLKRKP